MTVSALAAVQAPAESNQVASGRLLLQQFNCTACHAVSEAQAKWLSPKLAPRLTDLGGRADPAWVARYIASPGRTMPGTTMPDVLRSLPEGDRASAAESLTHYLYTEQHSTFKKIMPDRGAAARGEILYHRVGCVACHSPLRDNAKPISGSAPLPRMEEKWSFKGLRQFLTDPLVCRPSGRMPAMRLSDAEAGDIAHYLLRETQVSAPVELAVLRGRVSSLEDIDSLELVRTEPVDGFVVDGKTRVRGESLRFTGWVKIDQPGDYTFYLTADSPSRFAIDNKWLAGQDSWEKGKADAKAPTHLTAGWHELRVEYVHRGKRPAALKLEWAGPGITRQSIPASRLHYNRDAAPATETFLLDAAKAASGRALYEKLNCAACHAGKPVAMKAPPMASLHDGRGCLAETPPPSTPDFHLDAAQRASIGDAIQFLNRDDLKAPGRHQQIVNTLATFNCTACHARDGVGGVIPERDACFTSNITDTGDEGRLPPRLDGVGDKLLTGWIDAVLTQGASVRPYLDTRMPQFGKDNVGFLPALLVADDRHEQKLAPAPDDTDTQTQAGRKMVGTDGLSCIGCHRFNDQPAQTLQAIDLITAPKRLNEDWFRRFLLDPGHYHPGTRMPAFWPDGKSLLPTVLDGDTARQQAAIWAYLSQGRLARFPIGLSRANVELVVGGEAVVYRGKLWEAGFRAVAVGYPGQVNAAFDAEDMRLSLLWHGRFLNVASHWQVQGMGRIRPLGTDVIVLQHGSPMAVLSTPNTPWPSDAAKAMGMKFRGYQLDSIRRPTLLYSFGATRIEDFLTPTDSSDGRAGLRREITFVDPPPKDLYFRLVVGKLAANGEGSWRLNDSLTVMVKGGGKPVVRGAKEQQELLLPLVFQGPDMRLEVDYVW